MKLKEVYDYWLPQKQRQVKPTTMRAYQLHWRTHINPKWGDVEISEINKKNVRPWVYEKLDSGLAKHTVHDIVLCMRLILKYAKDEMEIDVPSMEWNIVWPTKNRSGATSIEPHTANVVQKVLAKTQEKPEPRTIALMIAFCSGMRIGELCGLQWDDVDLEQKVFHVKRTVSRIYDSDGAKTEIYIGNTKTASGTRDIPIVKNIIPILRKWKKFYPGTYYVASCDEKLNEPRIFREWSKRYMKRIGIDKILKFHAIRHTFATTLIESGVDVKSVSSIMGHADISTTLSLYVHPSEETKQRAVNKVFSKLF
ncbi:MAG: site-specific integrase [Muribaculum sp.]|nr:site-specific integrase [Muribaculum sp.]